MVICVTRPADWWDTGDGGNRLALGYCSVCPSRSGTTCTAGLPDPHPHGVIRAGVAYSDSGKALPICSCGYPQTNYRGGATSGCPHCSVDPTIPIPVAREVRRLVDEAVVERLLAGDPPSWVSPVDRREAMRRLWASGLTHREVALRLGMTLKAVRRAWHRAKTR